MQSVSHDDTQLDEEEKVSEVVISVANRYKKRFCASCCQKNKTEYFTIFLVGLRAAVGSAAGHNFSSEPSEQCARPSHTSSLGTHAVLSLHRKSPEAQEEKPREGGAN